MITMRNTLIIMKSTMLLSRLLQSPITMMDTKDTIRDHPLNFLLVMDLHRDLQMMEDTLKHHQWVTQLNQGLIQVVLPLKVIQVLLQWATQVLLLKDIQMLHQWATQVLLLWAIQGLPHLHHLVFIHNEMNIIWFNV